MSESMPRLGSNSEPVNPEHLRKSAELKELCLRKMESAGIHLNSGTFPDPRLNERKWMCYSTLLGPCWLMLHCDKTGAEGVVKDPSSEEWSWAFDCPSNPKPWTDNSRVAVMQEGSV